MPGLTVNSGATALNSPRASVNVSLMVGRLALFLVCALATLGGTTSSAAAKPVLGGKLAHGSWAGSSWRISAVPNRVVFTLSRGPSATDPGLSGTVSLWRANRRHTAPANRPFATSPTIGPSATSWTSQALAPGYYLVGISLQPASEPGQTTIIDWAVAIVYVPHSRPE
jgi:hypothetical protein